MSTATRTLVLTTASADRIRAALEQMPGIRVVERYDLAHAASDEELVRGLDGAWATVAGSEHYTSHVFAAAPTLKAIFRFGTGSDAIDITAATDAGVAVITTPAVNAEAVADMALVLMLACIRRLPVLDKAVRNGEWRIGGPTRDLAGATVGVVGMGSIGRAVIRRLHGFGCHVLALEPHPDREFCDRYEVELTDLETMLPRVDVLTLHAPLTDSTRCLIGTRELARLPRHAVVINTSRGDLIDQAALVTALHEHQIAAAGLDVFDEEPVSPGDPILDAPNAILTGHVSSYTELGLTRMGDAVVSNVRDVLGDRIPASTQNPEAWTRSGALRPARSP
jgi:D-3-phosphoglycerate dehydrogenase / 2-oxoglutarate reductase